ncbi:hypothetical protein MRB53_003274 [Persea americana]|uniref:Uncharacterized protein n=1 Tax=Persea americana TaxID=3435 RepID=A0ACC2MX47_PERAE|nr:hypothetical protein MRB53_003274 [Persea americana]
MVKGRQGERVRLYVRGTVLGYKRSKSNQYPNTSLIQIEGVNTKEDVSWSGGLMETPASYARSSNLTCLPNPWVQRFEFSCTPATFEVLSKRSFRKFKGLIPSTSDIKQEGKLQICVRGSQGREDQIIAFRAGKTYSLMLLSSSKGIFNKCLP